MSDKELGILGQYFNPKKVDGQRKHKMETIIKMRIKP
jgi:hypothetical protein